MTWLLVGFIIMVSSIFLPAVSSCDGWCCMNRRRTNNGERENLPYKPVFSNSDIRGFSKTWNEEKNGSKSGVSVLENFTNSMSTLHIPHHPIYNIARLAAEIRGDNSKSPYKNIFPTISLSGKRGHPEETFMMVYISQALCKPNANIIVNGMSEDSPALDAWTQLVDKGIVHWKETDIFFHKEEYWAAGTFKDINTNKCTSEYIYDIMKYYIELESPLQVESPIRYYVISSDRETELRAAYNNDKTFKVDNVTSAFHAAVLKVLFPTIQIVIVDTTDQSEPIYARALKFLTLYILV